jgi:hypothetical protein
MVHSRDVLTTGPLCSTDISWLHFTSLIQLFRLKTLQSAQNAEGVKTSKNTRNAKKAKIVENAKNAKIAEMAKRHIVLFNFKIFFFSRCQVINLLQTSVCKQHAPCCSSSLHLVMQQFWDGHKSLFSRQEHLWHSCLLSIYKLFCLFKFLTIYPAVQYFNFF